MAFYLQYDVVNLTHANARNPMDTGAECVIGQATIRFRSHAGNQWHRVPAGNLGVAKLTGVDTQYGTIEFYMGATPHARVKVSPGQLTHSFTFSGQLRFTSGGNS